MDRIIRYAAYAACAAQIIALGFILRHAYNDREFLVTLLLAVPPVLSLAALWTGPDREERRLKRQVIKLRLQAELQDLEKKTRTN